MREGQLSVTLAASFYSNPRCAPPMLVHPNFDPVAIHLGPISIRWYGLMYLVGFGTAFWLGRLRVARGKGGHVTLAILDDLLFFVVLGVTVAKMLPPRHALGVLLFEQGCGEGAERLIAARAG